MNVRATTKDEKAKIQKYMGKMALSDDLIRESLGQQEHSEKKEKEGEKGKAEGLSQIKGTTPPKVIEN